MIVVVGRAGDEVAQSLLARWQAHDAALLEPRDLSRRGWSHIPNRPRDGRAVISGRAVPMRDITGVVTTLDGITPWDLPHVRPSERPYVANEMHAFLLSWLHTIPCRVLNRPTPMSLAGPALRSERWSLTAAALGIPTAPLVRASRAEPDALEPAITVTLVGYDVFDAPSGRVARWTRQLAATVEASALVAAFRDALRPRLTAVAVIPDLRRADLAGAALGWLEGVPA